MAPAQGWHTNSWSVPYFCLPSSTRPGRLLPEPTGLVSICLDDWTIKLVILPPKKVKYTCWQKKNPNNQIIIYTNVLPSSASNSPGTLMCTPDLQPRTLNLYLCDCIQKHLHRGTAADTSKYMTEITLPPGRLVCHCCALVNSVTNRSVGQARWAAFYFSPVSGNSCGENAFNSDALLSII